MEVLVDALGLARHMDDRHAYSLYLVVNPI